MIRVDDEALATIMQQAPAFRCHDSGAKPVIQGVDQAAGIPVAINNADIDGALVAWQLAWRQRVDAECIADLGAKRGGIGRVAVHRYIDMRRVSKHRATVAIGEETCLDLVMDPHGGQWVVAIGVDTAHDIQKQKRDHARAILPDRMVAEAAADRCDIVPDGIVEILGLMTSAKTLQQCQGPDLHRTRHGPWLRSAPASLPVRAAYGRRQV